MNLEDFLINLQQAAADYNTEQSNQVASNARKELAEISHEMYADFCKAGFSSGDQAFELTKIWFQAQMNLVELAKQQEYSRKLWDDMGSYDDILYTSEDDEEECCDD